MADAERRGPGATFVTRRGFLKRTAGAGAAVAVLYAAPQFTSINAPKAYAAGTIPETPCALCDSLGKPKELTLRYTGNSNSSHSQDPGKVVVTGTPPGGSPVRIVVSSKSDPTDDKARTYFDGIVPVGGSFTLSAMFGSLTGTKLKATTYVHVYPNSSTPLTSPAHTVLFHTSCSQPLFIGDQFGSLVLTGFLGESGLAEDQCDDVICGKGFKIAKLVAMYTGDGDDATSHTQDPGKIEIVGDPDDASPVRILVTNKGGDRVWFDGLVNLNGTFVIDSANAGRTKLDSDTLVTIKSGDGLGTVLQTVKMHTSCSQPILAGDQFGSIRLISADTIPK